MVNTNPADFGGREVPFHICSFVGVRAFQIRDGALSGPIHFQEWTSGVNEAKCLNWRKTALWHWDITEPPAHEPGSPTSVCPCGFYAYFTDDDIDYYHGDTAYKYLGMLGIIEGWGRLTYADRGFRCSKARILALVEPAKVPPQHWQRQTVSSHDAWPTIAHKYAEVPYYHTLLEALMDHPLHGIDGQEVA